ncbi:protein rapunzel-like [Salarias fasciatus]|uniref:Protein rapunzel-like n=1 Tax=Salarias fasciatus TaxID=181472 RepID=A0A672I0F9_SALFA|nr:protein rapunzel-like [Salarias fasciatus]
MSSPLERAVAQKKEAIEAAMELLERGSEALAGAVGELFPLCEAAAPLLRLALDNVHSKEVFYVRERFLTVRNRLDVLTGQLEDIDREISRSRLDAQYFPAEENVRNQFRKYLDILDAKPQFRDVKTRLFLEHFARTGGEKNLLVLYDALMGTGSFGASILEVVDRYVERHRRLLEDFCVRMKELLCLGLIALLGHCALTGGPEEEQDLIGRWGGRVEEVERRMKAAVEACVAAFPEQAELDARRLLQEAEAESLQDAARRLLDFLVKKYDWVRWSVRLINHGGSSYRNWRAGEHFHHVAGQNWFEVLQVNNVNLVASYSGDPRPVDGAGVRQLMEGPARKGDAPAVVQALREQLDGFVVHAVSRHKESAAAWSFPDDCHYWERHKNVAVCVHSQ